MSEPDKPSIEDLTNRIDPQTRIFREHIELFEELKDILIATLRQGTQALPGAAIVDGRVKKVDSFVEKCRRKWDKYQQPAWQLTDLCGVRVIVLSQDAIAPVCQFIEKHFLINEQENAAGRLKEVEFGYQSVHYIVSLNEENKNLYSSPAGTISSNLFDTRTIEEAQKTKLPSGPIFKAEIQVRTLLQHAWSDAVHDNLYKTEVKNKPKQLVRDSALIAAQLEEADGAIVKLIQGAKEYRSYYGAYLSPEEIRDEIKFQQIVLHHDSDNAKAALKIARLADCLDDPDLIATAEQILTPFATASNAHALRELGTVQWKLGKRPEGRKNLEVAAQLHPQDPDTLCELGSTYIDEGHYRKALPWYERAFAAAPEYPRALMRYIECRILAGQDTTLDFISLIRLNLERAIEISLRRIRAGVHLPHAWYDIGFFKLLLGQNHESLQAYAKGILSTSSPHLVQAILDSLTEIQEVARNKNSRLVEGLTWIRSFLKVMLVGRFKSLPPESLKSCVPQLEEFTTLPPSLEQQPSLFSEAHRPIFLVAGSCSQASQSVVQQYEEMIHKAFADFSGTICCGGTDAGISGIIGRLPNANQQLLKLVGYQPKEKPCMSQYTCIHTTSGTFSPLDPLMLWADILMQKVDPASVSLLGVRGGEIAAFEYRLALLLGAKVGVIIESGGASRELVDDADWRQLQATAGSTTYGRTRLLALPGDRETLAAFVQQAMPYEKLDDASRELVAQAIHENYRQGQLKDKPDELAPWKYLDQSFKESNRGLVDHHGAKLRRVKLALRKGKEGQARLFSFTPEQLEELSEMEHGRWVVERLADGWVYGEKRDNVKKARPQLVPWSRLSEKEKQKDRDAIAKLPELLLRAGYEIFSPF